MSEKQYLTRKQATKYAKLASTSTIYEWTSAELLTTYTEKKLLDIDELKQLLEFRARINNQLQGKTIRPWQIQWLEYKEKNFK